MSLQIDNNLITLFVIFGITAVIGLLLLRVLQFTRPLKGGALTSPPKVLVPEIVLPPEAELEGKPPKRIWVFDRSGEMSYQLLPAKLKGNPGELVIPQPPKRGGLFDLSTGARTIPLHDTERQPAWLYFPKRVKGWIRAFVTDGGLIVPWGGFKSEKGYEAALDEQAKLFQAAIERKTMEQAYKGSSLTSQLMMGLIMGALLGAFVIWIALSSNPSWIGAVRPGFTAPPILPPVIP